MDQPQESDAAMSPDQVLRLLALRVAARGIDCAHCPYGHDWDPAGGCRGGELRFQACLEEVRGLREFGEGR